MAIFGSIGSYQAHVFSSVFLQQQQQQQKYWHLCVWACRHHNKTKCFMLPNSLERNAARCHKMITVTGLYLFILFKCWVVLHYSLLKSPQRNSSYLHGKSYVTGKRCTRTRTHTHTTTARIHCTDSPGFGFIANPQRAADFGEEVLLETTWAVAVLPIHKYKRKMLHSEHTRQHASANTHTHTTYNTFIP